MWIELTQHPLFYYGVLAVGLFLCGLSTYLLWETRLFLLRAIAVTGVVREVRENGQPSGHEDEVTWHPIVEFKDSKGKMYKFECAGSSKKNEFQVDELVSIIYDPEKPKRAVVKTLWRIWIFKLAPGLFGVCWIWAALRNL